MTKNEIADMLSRFAQGKSESWEFDDFVSMPQIGTLETFRLELAQLSETYPSGHDGQYCNPTGLSRINDISLEIRSLNAL